MAMALTHGGFDDDFFSGFPLSALLHGHMRGSDGNAGNRGIPLDVKEVSIMTGILTLLCVLLVHQHASLPLLCTQPLILEKLMPCTYFESFSRGHGAEPC